MEASASAMLNQQVFDLISKYFFSFASGGFVTLIIGGFIKEFFEKRNYEIKERRKWANEVLTIVNEGDSVNYEVVPSERRHISYVAIQIYGFHPEMSEVLRTFGFDWYSHATSIQNKPKSRSINWKEDEKLLVALQKKIDKESKYLVDEAHVLKK